MVALLAANNTHIPIHGSIAISNTIGRRQHAGTMIKNTNRREPTPCSSFLALALDFTEKMSRAIAVVVANGAQMGTMTSDPSACWGNKMSTIDCLTSKVVAIPLAVGHAFANVGVGGWNKARLAGEVADVTQFHGVEDFTVNCGNSERLGWENA